MFISSYKLNFTENNKAIFIYNKKSLQEESCFKRFFYVKKD